MLVTGVTVGCDSKSRSAKPPAAPVSPSSALFREVTAEVGIRPPIDAWPPGQGFIPDANPGGVAVLDYDGDGRLDILQTCHPPPGHEAEPAPKRLYHQNHDGTFTEVSGAAGLNDTAFGQGIAVGDFDNDGHPDVYFCNYGIDSLYHNNGDGTFTNVTRKAGISTKPNWSTAAAFFDYDRDGFLDLIVLHYIKFDPSVVCSENGQRIYCPPADFDGLSATLYHNNGNGTFTDVTETAGLNLPGKGLGVLCADLTGDGWCDIFVANDGQPNFLWVNQHDGTFKEEAFDRGCAVNGMGRAEGNMGVALGDVRGSGGLDLFVTHLAGEKNTLFGADNNHHYRDSSLQAGMAAVDLPYTGWGTGFLDFDNSGTLDVAVVNGRIRPGVPQSGARGGPFWSAYGERNLLFQNDGAGHFRDVSERGGEFTRHVEVTRGLAFGDLTNSGRIDMVTNAVDNALRIYRNVAPQGNNHWLTVRALVGQRDAIGAQVTVSAGARRYVGVVLAGYSSSSSSDPRVHFGLGNSTAQRVEVIWPDGGIEQFDVTAVDQVMTLRQGTGRRKEARPVHVGKPAPRTSIRSTQ